MKQALFKLCKSKHLNLNYINLNYTIYFKFHIKLNYLISRYLIILQLILMCYMIFLAQFKEFKNSKLKMNIKIKEY